MTKSRKAVKKKVVERHVFLSYAREDEQVAKRVRRQIRKLEVPAWQDVRDLVPGVDYKRAIVAAIRQASALVVVVTRASMQSAWVTFECARADDAGIPVIPALAQRIKIRRKPLATYQQIDLTSRRKVRWQLADALTAPTRSERAPKGRPRLRASFSINDGEPWYEEGDELAIKLQVDNAPSDVRRVRYRLHSKTFNKAYRNQESTNVDKRFKVWIQSFGDVLVSAELVAPLQTTVIRETLFSALRRRYKTDRRRAVREAIRQIRDE